MKKIKYLGLGLFIVLTACSHSDDDNNKVCNVDNPLENIFWLKDIKQVFDMNAGPQRQRIVQYKYSGKDVFLIESCYQCPDAVSVVYDCDKNVVCEFGGIIGINTCPDFEANAINKIILYDN